MYRPGVALVLVSLAAACSPGLRGANVRTGEAAYALIPAPQVDTTAADYVIGPLDTLDITVFNEPEISAKGVPVDVAGNLALPLIGRMRGAGFSATDLADALGEAYGRFYVAPQVTVIVTSSVSQRVTVQGQVAEPGLYELRGSATLLDAISLAKGESENAALREVLVIRTVEGKRMAALFDLHRIRRGDDPDPAIIGRDVIVVGNSDSKKAWHDLLRAAPLLNVFAQFN